MELPVRGVAALLTLAFSVAGCGTAPAPSMSAVASPTAAMVGSPIRIATPRCPPAPFDAAASPLASGDDDVFLRDESSSIAQGLLDSVARIYANAQTEDVCRIFTDQGWTTALAFDPRLRAVERGESLIEQHHVLRIAFEGDYDRRDRPPVIPLDIIYDIPAGATTKDLPSGETRTSTADQRDGFHAEITFDGHRWRIDRVGPVGEDYHDWLARPTIPPTAPPCSRLVRDPDGAPFDDGPERVWCDADGHGRLITRNQVVLLIGPRIRTHDTPWGYSTTESRRRPPGDALHSNEPLRRAQTSVRDHDEPPDGGLGRQTALAGTDRAHVAFGRRAGLDARVPTARCVAAGGLSRGYWKA